MNGRSDRLPPVVGDSFSIFSVYNFQYYFYRYFNLRVLAKHNFYFENFFLIDN